MVAVVSDSKGNGGDLHQLESGSMSFMSKSPHVHVVAKAPPSAKSAANGGGSLEWGNVNITLRKSGKVLMNSVSGCVKFGEVCAILGPSGAGKSSLLQALSGRLGTNGSLDVNLQLKVNGNMVNPSSNKYKKQVAYVMQNDALFRTATPREAMTFSAKLRLPKSTTDAEIEKKVGDLVKELGLSSCADTIIGSDMLKGISGGEMKRTAVGVELVTDPDLIFLDEPTSGLDSFSAAELIDLLKKKASTGAAVLLTIHQPASEVFNKMDNVILMKSGNIIFNGSPSRDLASYFSDRGFALPANTNPSDFIMDVAQRHSIEALRSKNFKSTFKSTITLSEGKEIPQELESLNDGTRHGFKLQGMMLIEREVQSWKRDPSVLGGRFGVTIFLNIIFACIFYDAGRRDSADFTNLSSHFGSLTMVAISSMFGSAQPTLLQFPAERPIFLREYSTGTYSAAPYFFSKVLLELVITYLQIQTQFVVVYWLIGYQGSIILLTLAGLLLGLASASVGILIGCIIADPKLALEMVPLLFVPQMLFSGFFVRLDQIPSFLRWAQYLCALKYALNLQMIVEFSDCGNPAADARCDQLFVDNNIEEDDWWWYILILLLMFVFYRSLAIYFLRKKATTFF